MVPVIETHTLVPHQVTGAWIAQFRFFFGLADYDAFVFLAPLTEAITVPQDMLASGVPLEIARKQFLHDVVLTVKH